MIKTAVSEDTSKSNRIYLGHINKKVLDKEVCALDGSEKNDYTCLKDCIHWCSKNGYCLVMTNDDDKPLNLNCWMIKHGYMKFLDLWFKEKVHHIF